MPEFKKNPSPFMLKSGNSPLYKNLGSNWKGSVVTGFGKEADVKMTNLVKDQSVLSKYKHAKSLNPDFNLENQKAKQHFKKWGGKKKVLGKVAKKVGSKFLGPLGVISTIYDVGKIAKHTWKSKSLKKGIKKWWNE